MNGASYSSEEAGVGWNAGARRRSVVHLHWRSEISSLLPCRRVDSGQDYEPEASQGFCDQCGVRSTGFPAVRVQSSVRL
jgi:hypothetical protein